MDDSDSTARAFTEALGSEIVYWRKRRGMSRDKLADEAGISGSTMGRIERDGPKDVTDTWRIAEALGLTFHDLVRRAEEAVALDRQAHTHERLLEEDVEEADRAVKRLDEHARRTRPARTREEMQQMEPDAARNEDHRA